MVLIFYFNQKNTKKEEKIVPESQPPYFQLGLNARREKEFTVYWEDNIGK